MNDLIKTVLIALACPLVIPIVVKEQEHVDTTDQEEVV